MGKRLGRHQLDLLSKLAGVGRAPVVGDRLSDSLVRRGLLLATDSENNALVVVTPAGYRAVADAIESGVIPWPPQFKPRPRDGGAGR